MLQELIAARAKHKLANVLTLNQALNWVAFRVPPLADLDLEYEFAITAVSTGLADVALNTKFQLAKLELLSHLRSGEIVAVGRASSEPSCISSGW